MVQNTTMYRPNTGLCHTMKLYTHNHTVYIHIAWTWEQSIFNQENLHWLIIQWEINNPEYIIENWLFLIINNNLRMVNSISLVLLCQCIKRRNWKYRVFCLLKITNAKGMFIHKVIIMKGRVYYFNCVYLLAQLTNFVFIWQQGYPLTSSGLPRICHWLMYGSQLRNEPTSTLSYSFVI